MAWKEGIKRVLGLRMVYLLQIILISLILFLPSIALGRILGHSPKSWARTLWFHFSDFYLACP